MSIVGRHLERYRGVLRLDSPMDQVDEETADDFQLSGEPKASAAAKKKEKSPAPGARQSEPSWLVDSRKLIPGEALAGYISLQPIAAAASQPENLKIVLAIVFAIVTFMLRWFGTQNPKAKKPRATVQWSVVFISTLSYVLLVYAMGGQIFWHSKLPDQQFYAQIFAAALGILGPYLSRWFVKQK